MGEVKSDGVDEEMKNDIDCVRELLDRFKDGKEKDESSKATSSSELSNDKSSLDAKQNELISELQTKTSMAVANLKPVLHKTQDLESKTDATVEKNDNEENNSETSNKEGPQKRKQDRFLVEIQERAEVISKSARKSPKSIVSSIETVEDDPETEDFLKTIRAVPSSSTQVLKLEGSGLTVQRRKSASDIDFSYVVSNCSGLNVEPQKSKISLGRQGSLKGRRKPTASVRRRSLKQGVGDDWDDADKISEGEESMEEGVRSVTSSGSFLIKDPPQFVGSTSNARPRTKPKPRVKSKTISGIGLPGLAEELNRRMVALPASPNFNVKRSQGSAAEIVRAAAEGKKNLPVKEEKKDKEPEKPAWLVEAEARRKLHEKRRQVRTRPANEDSEDSVSKPQNVILRPVRKAEPVTTPRAEDENGESNKPHNVILYPVPKSVPVASKKDDDMVVKSHNVFLRSVKKTEPVTRKTSEDEGETKTQRVSLRPVVRSIPTVNKSEEEKTIASATAFLRPVKRPDPETTHNGESAGRLQPIRLKSIGRTSGSGPSVTAETVPTATDSLAETVDLSSPTRKTATQSLSYIVTALPVDEKDKSEVCNSRLTEGDKSRDTPEYRIVRSAELVSSEKPAKSSRQDTTTSEFLATHSSRVPPSKVTVSSNYVSAPKTRPKPSVRSQTVKVTATEVPEVSTARRTSLEIIDAKVGRLRPNSTIVTATEVKSRSDYRSSWRGNEYCPTYSGDVLPQWKFDLMEKKRNAVLRGETSKTPVADRSQPHNSNAVVIPQWKKELTERRKQRGDAIVVQNYNKENHKTSPEVPQWKKAFSERMKRSGNSAVREQPNNVDRSADVPEWQQRLSSVRRIQANIIPRSQSEETPVAVPSFMKEFEKKKKKLSRGGHTSYV